MKNITQNNITKLYYFSGTGNSLYMAKTLKEKLDDCELLPIAGLINQSSIIATSEKVGFIFPVYTWALPKIVADFIEKIDLSNAKYIFALCTKGGPGRQYVIPVMNNLLKPKNKELDAAFLIKVFSAVIFGGHNPMHSKEKQLKRIKNAESKLDEIAKKIRNNEKVKGKKGTIIPMKGEYTSFIEKVNTDDENYYTDENCNGCGICQKICPVNNIKLVNDKPEWQHQCQQCLGCLHYCPQKAIQYGEHTPGRERYNHPFIKVKELINQKNIRSN
ncbi:MAG: EFR1 family ferrodoxin [Candidatus Lokiarchaeota archaeon]|nr:EFR1 family ferrodoxin [Candidatus Lokiarchaeota archaeon]